MRVKMPGRLLSFDLPSRSCLGVFEAPAADSRKAAEETVADALADPIGSPPLREIAAGSRNVVIIVDDVTRPTPTEHILPPILEELARGGVDREACSILVAGGTHRTLDADELERKLGPEAARSMRVECHSARSADLVSLPDPEGRVSIQVNSLAAEADFLIGVGQILPHAIAGLAGGAKIVAPGICSRETIRGVHWSMHRATPGELYWSRDNPVREVIDRVGRTAGLRFLVNVILDRDGGIAAAVAGDMVDAHREGCRLAQTHRAVTLPRRADVVIADALPFDVDWWQAIKALPSAARICRPGGTIIVLADCPEGFAPEYREPLTYGYPPRDEVIRMVQEGTLDGIVGAHMLIGSAALDGDRRIVLVSGGLTEDEVAGMGFVRRGSIQEAVEEVLSDRGPDAAVAVLPAAAQVIPRIAVRDDDG